MQYEPSVSIDELIDPFNVNISSATNKPIRVKKNKNEITFYPKCDKNSL